MEGSEPAVFSAIANNLQFIIPMLVVLVVLIIIYLAIMIRAIIEMLKYGAHGVLLTFAFIALVPFPLILIMGIAILIIWHYHKRDILEGKRVTA